MAPLGRRGTNKSAKEVLDEIGETIQKKAHSDADTFRSQLKGNFGEAKFYNGGEIMQPNSKLCELDHTIDTNVTDGHSNPCEGRQTVRFPDDNRSQCTKNRIKDSVDNSVGACAPYRRLHLCSHNLESIQTNNYDSSKAKHNLLAEVCYAAKFEGESIVKNYEQLGHHTTEGICTALARSFADIGDIIRGKDLYLGNPQESARRKQLEDNLRKIFDFIYKELTSSRNGKTNGAEERYKDGSGNYYKLREDWWNANRLDIWKAMICKAPGNAQYFRNTCSNGEKPTGEKCQCIDGTVPTNLDYVPQYLRWFEEWAEEFCRKRNLKLQNAIKNCHGMDDDGKEKYCSRNGYDCTKTIRSIDKYSMNRECTKCLYVCDPYVKWIDNKKKEFEKQKKKCENEIYRNNESSQNSPKNYNNMYETDFYGNLKKDYQSMNDFLKLLNSETPCTNIIDEKRKIDFTKDPEETFSHTEYCDPCPWCGLKKQADGTWKRLYENDPQCPIKPKYEPPKGEEPTEIDVLYTGKENKDIIVKLREFCKTDGNTGFKNEEWNCYYQVGNDKCVLENGEELGGEKKVKDYDNFLMFWVAHMLKDSIEWRSKLSNCLKSDKKTCIKKCNDNCKCYEKWIGKKKVEWTQIKKHFDKQTDFQGWGRYFVLETVLEGDQFFTDITKAYGDAREIVHIQEMLQKKKEQVLHEDASNMKTIIDELLDHELKEAKQCIVNHKDNNCPDDLSDSEDEEEDIPQRQNPCAKPSGSAHRALVNKVASNMHHKKKRQLVNRGVSSKLKGDAAKGEYRKSGTTIKLKDICSITNDHSNAKRGHTDQPCKRKDSKSEMFRTEDGWKPAGFISKTYKDIYMPPRRQHFCTSNLEYLQTTNKLLNGNDINGNPNIINDSFLGDVLFAANYEADFIKKMYKKQNDYKDNATICRAMKYSFADLGDIIKGTDMWDNDSGESKTRDKLREIFDTIKKKHPGIKEIYKEDTPYTKLREDWWEANRKKIWEAMQCPTPNGSFPCKSYHTPLDDYIPQRLRWMTEWAEWFCKEQKKQYGELVSACNGCKDEGKVCTNKSSQCTSCMQACENYKNFINTWKEQWDKMEIKYKLLYLQAQTTAANGGPDTYSGLVDENEKPVVNFLFELYKENGGKIGNPRDTPRAKRSKRETAPASVAKNDVYSTAAGYVHQEMGPHMECKTQTEFCEKTDEQYNENYTFKNPPPQYKDACICNTRPPPKEDSRKRSEDSDEEEKVKETKVEEKATEDAVDTGPPPAPKEATTTLDVCPIVAGVLTKENLENACPTKYGPKAPTSWKCIPTEKTNAATGSEGSSGNGALQRAKRATVESGSPVTSNSGSICIPPRRRRLYIQKLHDWASGNTVVSGQAQTPQGGTSSPSGKETPSDKLRTAFIQSAAIETFFLWDRYKKEKEIEKKEKKVANGGLVPSLNGGPPQQPGVTGDSPQSKLQQTGVIPPPFLRQMFYTLGDYADIFFGKNDIVIDTKNGDKDIAEREKKIKDAIERVLKNADSQPPSDEKRQTWWEQNGEHIWNGMICALTYKEKDEKGTPLKQNEGLKSALWDEKNKKPKDQKYQYDKVKLDENSGTSPKTNDHVPPTPLTNFISRPPYFRYLEEWGETFCRERKKRLEKIKVECMDEDGKKQKCSGDGEDCEEIRKQDYSTVRDFYCPECGKYCRFYKRWIEKKKDEYDKQKEAYNNQKTDARRNNNDNAFSTTLDTCTTAGDFLQTLKNGPCKNDNVDDSGENKKIFDENGDTFKYTQYCGTCSLNGFKCNGDDCRVRTNVTCNGSNRTTTITADDIKNGGNSAEINMLVSDDINSGNGFNDLEACKNANIFKGIKENKWKCVYFCKSDVCGLKKNNDIDQNQIILIRALFKRWLEYFLDDYNKIRKKLNPCINNGEKAICTNGCVEQWINQKRTEWTNIKNRFNEQYNGDDTEMKSSFRSFLVDLIRQIAATIDKGNHNGLVKLVKSVKCNCGNNSQNGKEGEENDLVLCLLQKLEKKAEKCKDNPETSGIPQQPCEVSPNHIEDEEQPLEEEENTVEHPKICDDVLKTQPQPEEPGETCEESPGPTDVKEEEEEEKKEEKDKEEEPGLPPPTPPPAAPSSTPIPPKPKPPPQVEKNPWEHPAVIPALVTSTLAWSVGIGFAAFTYFYLKVLYICGCGCMWMYMYLCGVFGYIYIYISVYVCVLYIFYIYVFILKKGKNEKKEKKKKEI
uniref:Erythrocyte membrane protein 1 n=2 Tax=Plasmodium falciparum TaxID=5833 RepID=Q94657_PLAFA|nr:erythrocyte membrane protein 1 [Plasmodium falciparum]